MCSYTPSVEFMTRTGIHHPPFVIIYCFYEIINVPYPFCSGANPVFYTKVLPAPAYLSTICPSWKNHFPILNLLLY